MLTNYSARTVILIPHYNNLDGLEKSISSIHHAKGIDILVVDDGSLPSQTPDLEELQTVAADNSNVQLILSPENQGVASALNKGLDTILELNQYEFIARIDCGDTCVSNRFFLQENYLDQHAQIALVGSWVKWIDAESNNEVFKFKPACEHKKIKKRMSIKCNFIHPAVMFRSSVVKELGKYPDNYEAAEDYAYFFNISKNFETGNIPKYLTKVDYNKEGISIQNRRNQNLSKLKIIRNYGKKDIYKFYGVMYNLTLLLVPSKLVLFLKKNVF